MEAMSFERRPMAGRVPSSSSTIQPRSRSQSAQREEAADLSNSGSATSLAASSSSKSPLAGLTLPVLTTEAKSQTLPKDMRVPNLTPLPDFKKKSVLILPDASRSGTSSREPSAGPSAQQQLDQGLIKDLGNKRAQTPGSIQARESGSGPSSRPAKFDCISIPVSTSSPPSSAQEFVSSRKRAMSVSSSQQESRKRRAATMRSASNNNNVPASPSSPLSDPDSPSVVLSDGLDGAPQAQPPPSSQRNRPKAKLKKKASAQTLFQKPTDYEKIYSTKGNTSEDRMLLEEAELALKDSKARYQERVKESVVPSKVRALTSCPFCSNPWPKNPSKRLVNIGQPLLDQFHKSKGRALEDMAHLSFCALHEEEASIIPQGKERGWPTAKELKWRHWENIFFEGGPDGEYDWVLRQLCERVLKPETSSWLRTLQEKASKEGTRAITSAAGLLNSLEDERVGYFGEVGSNEMMKWLKRAFIENDIPEERNPFPGAVYDFDTPERQASLQPLNANGFIARCLLPELACCLIQVRDDCSFEEANRIRTESSAYGDAILPMLADKDEDDYLEFDLRRDVQKDDSPPSSSSLVPLPPAGTPKRRNLRGLSSQSSSPATRKEVPSSDGMPESSDSPLFTNTGRPLRAAAVEALDAVKAFERPKPRPRASIDSAPTEAPSSRATFRPRARQFQRVASGASMGRISVYSESDEEDQMPAPSQMPPASQRPRPRPVAKSKSTPIDVDSDDDLPRAKSGPNKRTNPGGAKPASTQKRRLTRTTSTGSVISEHETLQEAPVAGSSQDPIALQSSDAEGEMDDKTVKDTTPEQSRPNAVPASSNTSTREDSFSILQPADVEQPTPPTSQLQTSNFSSSDVFTQISQQCAAQPANPNDTWFHQGTRSHPPPAVHLETDHRGYAEQAAMPIDANFVMLAHQNPQFQGHYDSASSSTSYADQVATVRLENQSQRTPQASMSNSGRLWNQPDSGKRPDSPRHPGSTSRHASFPNLPPQEHPFGNTAQPPFAHQQATMSHTSGPGANVGHGTYTGMLESVDSSTYGAQSFPYGYGQQQYQHSQYQQVPQPQNHQHYHHRQIQQGHAAAAQHAHVAAPTSFPEAMNFARPVQGHSDPFFRRRLNGQAHTGQDGEGMMTIPSGSVAVGPSNLPQPAHSSQQHAQTSSFTQQMYTQQAYGHDQSWAHGRQGPHHF